MAKYITRRTRSMSSPRCFFAKQRGKADARCGAVREYDGQWTSPYIVKTKEKLFARLEGERERLEHSIEDMRKKIEAAPTHIAIAKKKAAETTSPDLNARDAARQSAGIKAAKAAINSIMHELADIRGELETVYQIYTNRCDEAIWKVESRLTSYWDGVVRVNDTAPIKPSNITNTNVLSETAACIDDLLDKISELLQNEVSDTAEEV